MAIKEFFISLDQTLNTLLYIPQDGWGYSDEMLSARVFRCYLQGYITDTPMKIIDKVFFWDYNHCYECWEIECSRKQLPNHYRDTK